MCNCNLPTGAVCVRTACRECIRRAHEGPNYDPKRRTGRTSNAVKQAVFAAAFGQRVAFICSTQVQAEDACREAAEFIHKALDGMMESRASTSRDKITFYFANGTVSGMVLFRGMSVADNINRGMRDAAKFTILNDHYVDELLAERVRAEQRLADSNEIKRLLRKNGWTRAEDLCNPGRDKIVFRT